MNGSRPVEAHLAKPKPCTGSGNLGHRVMNASVRIPRRERRRGFCGRVLLAVCAVAVVVFAASAERAAAQTGPTTPVTIPDANLRAKLESVLMKAPGATITRGDLEFRRVLDLSNAGIRDLTGLEYAVNLISLSLEGNELSDCTPPCTQTPVLTPLAGLTQLASLGLYLNQISDLTPLAGLAYLRTLDVSSNRISDLTPLARLTSLTTLELADNRISDLRPLAGLIHLTLLTLQDNRITDLRPLASLTAVTSLFLNNNPVTDLTPLQSMTSLSYLTLTNCWLLTDLSPLESMTSLQRLSVDGTAIEDIGPLARSQGFTQSIARIDLRENPYLNADTARHVTTLRSRTPPVNVIAHSPLTLNRVVRNVRVMPGVTSLTVTWDALSTAPSFNPTGYRVQWKSAGEFFTIRATPARHHNSNGLSTTTYTIPNLTGGTEYAVQVRPTGDYGPPSRIEYGTPFPVLTALKVEDVMVSPGVESLVIEWKSVVGAADYKIQWKSGDQEYDSATRQATAAGANTETTIRNLEPGVEYTIRVIAVRADRLDGPASDEKTGTPLTGLTINIVPKIKSLDISWNRVDGADGYTVQWKSGDQEYDSATRQATVDGADTRSFTIPNLDPGTEYTVRVIATSDGEAISEREKTGVMPLGDKIAQVTGLTLDVEGKAKSITVSWNRVDDADGYKVQWRKSNEEYDSATREATVAGADTTTYTIDDLTPDTQYTVRVIATRADKDGPPSDEKSARTKHDPGEQRRVLSMVLAGVGRTLATDAVEILSSRSGTPVSRLSVTLGGQVLRLTEPPGGGGGGVIPIPLRILPLPLRERAGVRGLPPHPQPSPAPAHGSASRAWRSAWPGHSASPWTFLLPLRERPGVKGGVSKGRSVSQAASRPARSDGAPGSPSCAFSPSPSKTCWLGVRSICR